MILRKEPSEELCAARRRLEELERVKILRDWYWDETEKKWILHCSLTTTVITGSFVPGTTNWYVLVEEPYPIADIKFYPDKEDGLSETFQHQNLNSKGDGSLSWREGCLCLDTGVKTLGRHGFDSEPYGYEERLLWHFKRALDWLEAASNNRLISTGDPFELPYFEYGSSGIVAFTEQRRASIVKWKYCGYQYGLAKLSHIPDNPSIHYIISFSSVSGEVIQQNNWGNYISNNSVDPPYNGVWVLLNNIPVISPWQVPVIWSELLNICSLQGVDIEKILQLTAKHLRDARRHFILLGFPIPEKFQEEDQTIHWQALKLPELSYGKHYANGFRRGEEGYWQRDRMEILRKTMQIDWVKSQNWHRNEVLNRGKLPLEIVSSKFLMIGAGTIGASLSEMLVRAGTNQLSIIDEDIFTAGNLSRHTLTIESINSNKAKMLALHLNKSYIHANVDYIQSSVPLVTDEDNNKLDDYRVIFDCTGEDSVLYYLSQVNWTKPKKYFSISIGMKAKRVFLFCANGVKFPYDTFRDAIRPFLMMELEEFSGTEFPREGIGCWHPVFPARCDDIWLDASCAFKQISLLLREVIEMPVLYVYEQVFEGNDFLGMKLTEKVIINE